MAQVARIAFWMILLSGVAEARWGISSGGEKDSLNTEKDVVHELTSATFNSTLAVAPATWALVEFYAHWCGHCQNFKPHYERVARLFNGPKAVHAGQVYLARVDCAEEANQAVCGRFVVNYYPTLLWAAPPIFASGDRLTKGAELEEVKGGHSAEKLLEWINKRVAKNVTYLLNETTTNEAVVSSQTSEVLQMAASVHDIEEATATAFKIMQAERLLTPNSRGPFIQFLQLLVVHHPSKRCRMGSADLLVNLTDLWAVGETPLEAFSKYKLCGQSSPGDFWVSCRGEKRGYNCGLWLLFHSLSVRVSDSESTAAFWAIRGFVANFFNCEECQKHFLKMSSSVLNTTITQRDLSMWLWQAHNEVNKRLGKEAAEKADSKLQKTIWPSKQLCSACLRGSHEEAARNGYEPDWNKDAVYKFLMDWYGPSLQPLPKTRTKELEEVEEDGGSGGSAVKGAMGGILIVSCGFALISWWWHKQQKKRKHMRRRL